MSVPVVLNNAQLSDRFMMWIDTWEGNFGRCYFSYLMVRQGESLALIKGALFLNSVGDLFDCPSQISFDKYSAGYVEISGGKDAVIDLCSAILTGALEIDGKPVAMIGDRQHGLTQIIVDDLEWVIPTNARREVRCRLVGSAHEQELGEVVNWLLRSADPPFESLVDLCTTYRLGQLSAMSVVDVIALSVIWTHQRSIIQDGVLRLYVTLLKGLEVGLCTVGYRVLSTEGKFRRGTIQAGSFTWEEEEGHFLGAMTMPLSPGDIVQCFAAYDGRAQHQWWVIDPKRPQNPRRAILELHDEGLQKLKEWLSPVAEKKSGKQNDFEAGVQTLGWMLGFATQHLMRSKGLTDAPDIVFVCDAGIVVVECTVGAYGSDKLAKLVARRDDIREHMAAIGHRGVQVECAIIAFVSSAQADIERRLAAQYQVGFIGKDSLQIMFDRSFRLPDANALFLELQKSIHDKKQQFDQDQSSV